MNSSIKYCLLLAGVTLGLSATSVQAAAAADNTAALFADPVVAKGNGFEVKRSQLDDAFISYNASLSAHGGSIPEEQRTTVRSNLLQHLIINDILKQRATPQDKTATQKLVDENIEEARKSAPTPAAFDEEIKASGMTLEQVRNRAYEEQLCRRVWEREVTNSILITDADAKKFFDQNPDKFERPEEVRAAHVLISTLDPITQKPLPADQKLQKKKLAEEVKAKAEKGEDFAKLAKEYSDDPGSKNKGGEYTFPHGQMVPEFDAAAFSLKTNQVSDLVETRFGYHIIKLLEKFPAKHETFDEVKGRIKNYLVEKEAQKQLPAYFQKLKTDYNVALLDSSAAPK